MAVKVKGPFSSDHEFKQMLSSKESVQLIKDSLERPCPTHEEEKELGGSKFMLGMDDVMRKYTHGTGMQPHSTFQGSRSHLTADH